MFPRCFSNISFSSILPQQLQRLSIRRSPAIRKLRLYPSVIAQILASIA